MKHPETTMIICGGCGAEEVHDPSVGVDDDIGIEECAGCGAECCCGCRHVCQWCGDAGCEKCMTHSIDGGVCDEDCERAIDEAEVAKNAYLDAQAEEMR